ncbi:hypothetical protein PaeBR_08595 [Paenibacillus sp. BR2-3]|uniref:hypothetical protein n=1 Tax=Paenibacillus sp. BR2-3 TaxID=3048494 RepID=UPI003977550F
MKEKTTLESMVEDVLKELTRSGYCQSTIRNYKKVYARLLKSAAILRTDTLVRLWLLISSMTPQIQGLDSTAIHVNAYTVPA